MSGSDFSLLNQTLTEVGATNFATLGYTQFTKVNVLDDLLVQGLPVLFEGSDATITGLWDFTTTDGLQYLGETVLIETSDATITGDWDFTEADGLKYLGNTVLIATSDVDITGDWDFTALDGLKYLGETVLTPTSDVDITGTWDFTTEDGLQYLGTPVSRIANGVVDVFTISDFPDASGTDITLTSDLFRMKAQIITVNALIIDDTLQGNLGAINFTVNNYVYLGAGTWLSTAANSGTTGLFVETLFTILNNGAATVYGAVGTSPENTTFGVVAAIFSNCVYFGANLGSLENFTLITYEPVGFIGYTTGLTFTDCIEVSLVRFECTSNGFGTGPTFTIEGNTGETFIGPGVFRIASGEQGIRIDPGISDDARIQVQGINTENDAPLFDTSALSGRLSGTFTVVANASFSGTSITSVDTGSTISGGNAALFNSTATVYVNQLVTVTGYSTNTTYNVTARVTVSVPGTSFELLNVLDHGTESGGLLASDSITVTDTTNVLEDGDGLVLNTTGSTAYDGGGVVYNRQIGANTFQINRAHAGATASGTWSTAGLDQKDPRVLAFNNPNFVASKYIVCGAANGNTALTSFASGAVDTYQAYAFDIAGDGEFTQSSTTERWKLIDAATATFECTSNEPVDGSVTFNITLTKNLASTEIYVLTFSKSTDGGTSYTPLEAETAITIGNGDTKATTLTMPMDAVKGDLVRPEIQSPSILANASITATYFSMFGE
jgi:hypothetical protein